MDAEEQRASTTYAPHNLRFLVREKDFKRQYSHIYSSRLATLRPLALAAVTARWALGTPRAPRLCPKIVDLRPDTASAAASEWVVCGCIYKDMAMKPSILDSYSGSCTPPLPPPPYSPPSFSSHTCNIPAPHPHHPFLRRPRHGANQAARELHRPKRHACA